MKKKYTYLIVIFLIVASCAAFGRIIGNDFIVSSDDTIYITENNYVKSGFNTESIKWAFTAAVKGNWHPLTMISHLLDWNLFGANASGHHIVSLLLHIGAVIFLFLFLYKTTNNIWPAAFAAAFFALHPLRVESVAYAAERKDVLSMFFGMASIYAYAFYAESSKLPRYFLCLILFVLALMSKPMLVTLPFVLMLLDYWPLGRWQDVMSEPARNKFKIAGKLIGEKVPFICLTIATSVLAFWTQKKIGFVVPLDYLPFSKRMANAIVSYASYLEKTFWPVDLALFYPYDFSLPLWIVLISIIILLTITLAVLYYIKKLPFLFTGWFWYLGTLIPVIGLIQLGELAMADRYTYLPSVGIAIMLAWGIPLLFKSGLLLKKILFPTAIASLAILAFLTWQQSGYWKNDIVLWSHALKVTKDSYIAHSNLASFLIEEGTIDEAIYHCNEAIRLNPYYCFAYNYRGIAYAKRGQYQLAIESFSEAIRLKPEYAVFYNNRGVGYLHQGNKKQSCSDLQKACELGYCKILESAKNKGYCH